MASTQVNPTRMELTRLKKKLATATRGHKLLKDKRDELMRQFLDLVRENMALRQKVEAGIRSANVNFVIAKAGMSEQALNTALAAPKQAVYLEADKKNVMSVDIPVFHYKTRTADENDIYSYGFAFTSSDLDGAVKSLADILPDMLRLSETEKACQLMAAEIEKTRRRVNALEHVIIPEARKNIKYITMKLDENERSTQIRLMKVKDMMLEEKHHYKEKRELCQGRLFAHSCENDGTSPRGSNRPFDIPLFACFHYRCSPMTDCVRPVRTPVFKMRTKIYERRFGPRGLVPVYWKNKRDRKSKVFIGNIW